MTEECPLCTRSKEPNSEFCNLHDIAVRNLEDSFTSWNKALGGTLTKDEYFSRLAELPETGRSVKEVIKHIRGKGERSK